MSRFHAKSCYHIKAYFCSNMSYITMSNQGNKLLLESAYASITIEFWRFRLLNQRNINEFFDVLQQHISHRLIPSITHSINHKIYRNNNSLATVLAKVSIVWFLKTVSTIINLYKLSHIQYKHYYQIYNPWAGSLLFCTPDVYTGHAQKVIYGLIAILE